MQLRFIASIVTICTLAAVTANAADTSWIGGGEDNAWTNEANWSAGVPTDSQSVSFKYDGATINLGDEIRTVYNLDGSLNNSAPLVFEADAGGGLTFTQNADFCVGRTDDSVLKFNSGTYTLGGRLCVGWYYKDGRAAKGQVDVAAGATVMPRQVVFDIDHGYGVVNVNGGNLTTTEGIYVGAGTGGIGELNVTGGGVVSGTYFPIGEQAESKAYVNINGGSLYCSDWMPIGRSTGTGYLNVTNGSVNLQSREDATQKKNMQLGQDNGSKGYLTVDNGGIVNVNYLGIGQTAGGYGEVTVKTGGTLNIAGSCNIGDSGVGKLVLDGGTINFSGNPLIANNASSTGTIHVISGTLRSGGNDFHVSKRGVGTLTIDGGTVSCSWWCSFNRDIGNDEEISGSTINLNRGGTLNVGSIHMYGCGRATFNWNGGVFLPNTVQNAEYIFENVDKYDVNVLRHGAILDTNGKSRSINVALNGDGNFVLRGENNCWIKKAADLKRGVRVEGGSLSFEQGFVTETTATTPIKEIYVAAGKSLDLKGNLAEKPTIYVESFTKNGVVQDPGEYDDYNATIIVIAGGNTVATATWTGDAGDGDTANCDNWLCYNADGVLLFDALPAATSVVTVPFSDAALFEGFTAAKIIVETAGTVTLETIGATVSDYSYSGEVKATGDVKITSAINTTLSKAEAWYDPSDATTLTADGEGNVTAIANKGYRGAEMDAAAVNAESVPVVSDNAKINGLNALAFGNADEVSTSVTKTQGFKSAGRIPSTADQTRTMFSVAKIGSVRNEAGDYYGLSSLFLVDLADATGDYGRTRMFKGAVNQWDLNPKAHMVVTEGGNAYEFRCGDNVNDVANGSRPNGETETVYVYEMSVGDGGFVTTGYRNNNVTDGGTPATYYSLTAASSGYVDLYLGQARENSDASTGNSFIGETLVYTSSLTSDESALVRRYLKGKWLTGSGDVLTTATTLASLDLNGNTVDFDGANVAITNLYGSGTISNGTVTAIGTLNVVVNSDGTASKVVIPNGLALAGLKVNITGVSNLKHGQPAVVLESAAGAFTGAIAVSDITTDNPDFRYRLRVNAQGKLELSALGGFVLIFK